MASGKGTGYLMLKLSRKGMWTHIMDTMDSMNTHVLSANIEDSTGDVYPNNSQSISRCRFRQGQLSANGSQVLDVGQQIVYNPNATDPSAQYVTGAVHVPDGSPLYAGGVINVGQKAGVHQTSNPADDDISSYNERGELLAGKDRPLYGYRRYRVYFDPYNLPPTFKPNGLASYSVIGLKRLEWPI